MRLPTTSPSLTTLINHTSEDINLKESEEGCMGVFGGKKGKKNNLIML